MATGKDSGSLYRGEWPAYEDTNIEKHTGQPAQGLQLKNKTRVGQHITTYPAKQG